MLIKQITPVCTNKVSYDSLIARLPLASKAFDLSLQTPYSKHSVQDGFLHLESVPEPAMETEIKQYSEQISNLNPVFFCALQGRALNFEFVNMSGFDVVVEDYYAELREPPRNAVKAFTAEEIEMLNEEEKKNAPLRKREKTIKGFNADMRDFRERTSVATFDELTSNPSGSAIPAFNFIDPRYSMLVLTADSIGLRASSEKERIGALNVLAQVLNNLQKEIDESVIVDDNFRSKFKVLQQAKKVIQPLMNDSNKRLSINAKILDLFADNLTDRALIAFQRLSPPAKSN